MSAALLALVVILLLILLALAFRAAVAIVGVFVALGMAGCGTAPPKVPQTVTVVVEKFKPIPAWATDELPKPQPIDGTVGARNRSHEARGGVIDLANCHRRLLKKLDAGETVDPKECSRVSE